jgi:hypothetical protein
LLRRLGYLNLLAKTSLLLTKVKLFKKGDMMKKRYDTGGGVDFDADDDPESQKVFRDYYRPKMTIQAL